MNYLSLNFYLFRRENWSGWQKFVWVIQLFGSNFLIVLGIYSKLHKLIRPSPRSSLVGGQAALIFRCDSISTFDHVSQSVSQSVTLTLSNITKKTFIQYFLELSSTFKHFQALSSTFKHFLALSSTF